MSAATTVPDTWLDQALRIDPRYRTPFALIYQTYQDWCRDEGLPPCSEQALGRALRARGVKRYRRVDGSYWACFVKE